MDALPPAIRSRTLLQKEKLAPDKRREPLSTNDAPREPKPATRPRAAGTRDTPIDPLKLISLIGREHDGFFNF
jgi:hypothetical protein